MKTGMNKKKFKKTADHNRDSQSFLPVDADIYLWAVKLQMPVIM